MQREGRGFGAGPAGYPLSRVCRGRGGKKSFTQLGALPGVCSPFTSGSPWAREDPKCAEQPTGPSWVQGSRASIPRQGRTPSRPGCSRVVKQAGDHQQQPPARCGSLSLCFFPPFLCPVLSSEPRGLCLGLATAACNCSSSQTSVSLPQGWGWGCLGNAVGVVCLVVCSRNVGQTVKFFSPLVK